MSRANQPDPDAGDEAATGRKDDPVAGGNEEPAADGGTESPDEQWHFGLDDVGPDGIVEETSPGSGPIEPENVTLEHAAFVALGVAIAVGAVVTIFL